MSLDAAERWNLGIAGGALATSAALASPLFTASLALGTAMEIANYRALRRSAEKLFSGELGGSGAWTAGFGVRFGLLALCVVTALWAGMHPVGLVIGLSTMVPAVLIAGLRWTPPPVPAHATCLDPDDPEWERWNAWTARERLHDDDDEDAL